MRLLPPLVALFLVPTLAGAQDLVPSPAAPTDPDSVAHLIVADQGSGVGERLYAVDGRFAGDLNGDGLDDIVLPGATDSVLHLVFGSTSLDPTGQERRTGEGDSTLMLPDGCRDGDDRIRWASLGDVNGDGRNDLGVACVEFGDFIDEESYSGGAVVFLGRATWPTTVAEPDVVILGDALTLSGEPPMPTAGTRPGADIAGVGDIDGDGLDDFMLSGFDIEDPFRPTAWVFAGSPVPTAYDSVTEARWRIRGEPGAECTAPLFVAGLGDIDGDSIPDLAATCVVQPASATVVIDTSVWLGDTLSIAPPGDLAISTRSLRIKPSDDLVPYPSALSRLGDLDGDGYDEVAITSWIDGLSAVSGRLLAGHPDPWQDVTFFDNYWFEEEGTLDLYPAWRPVGTYDSADGLQMAPAGDHDGDGLGDLWVRVGASDSARVGLLASPSPSTWADGADPPFLLSFGTAGGATVTDDYRFGLGGVGDANGDGAADLLVTSGFAGDGCTVDLCGGAYLILCVDEDGDGLGVCDGDCDDGDETVLPGALEICDAIDHDCDGNDGSEDGDGDGVLVCDGDCDDNDPERYPGADETCDGEADLDCDGLLPGADQDSDGSLNCEDCQPFNAAMAPGNLEVCDGLDTDCDGAALPEELDVDQDGVPACSVNGAPADCDDLNALIRPGRFEDCFNGIDDNCDGAIDIDVDADGDGLATCDGDCDDTRANVFPGSTEACDGLDNNCNGVVDDARDDDGDGFNACTGDCDDRDPLRFPGNVGQCDPTLDADCSGTSDIADADGDGFSACGGDCGEGDPGISPGVADFCDGVDNNCDGVIDAPFDVDGDGWTTCFGDCRDDSELTYPQVVEPVCGDVRDGDCDGLSDAEDPDCAEDATPAPPAPRPYGLSCASSVGGGGSALLGLLLFAGLLARRRRGGAHVLLLLLAVALPGLASAAKKEPSLILYLSARPDLAAMQEAKSVVPKLEATEILHSTELLAPGEGLMARGARRTFPCSGTPQDLGSAVTRALDALIDLNYKQTVSIVDAAVAGLPCADRDLPARLLPNLFYYRGLAKSAIRMGEGAADFAQVIALAPEHPADPNFDPGANAQLEKARAASVGTEVEVSAFVLPGSRMRIDGKDLEPTADTVTLRPGLHVAQVRAGRVITSVVFEIKPDAPVVLVRAGDRERALRDATVSGGARAYAAAELSEAALTAEVDLVALVDLDVQTEPLRYLFRPSTGRFSFEPDWDSGAGGSVAGRSRGGKTGGKSSSTTPGRASGKVSSSGGADVARATGGRSAVRSGTAGPVLRVRVSGGFALTRPFPYIQIPVDIGIRIVSGLHLDLQIAAANPGAVPGGPVWLPTAAVGASWRFDIPVFQPRLGGAFQIGIDDSTGAIGPLPGWYGLAGFDVLIPGTPLLVGLDVRAGMLGKPFFVGFGAGLGVAL